ncbi:MAG: glutamine--fructose-6-phosphate transaminase (isomerizing) [Patescibacteria group bacterium]
MCGIMCYIGKRPAKNILYDGLARMEYRGYDSAGIALLDKGTVHKTRAVGDTSNLDLGSLPDSPTMGIGHTRWATHGKPSIPNAHPHTYGDMTLVHNGIIENYEELKNQIDSSKLQSQTDSEVLAGLIDLHYQKEKSLLEAVKQALAHVNGTYGLAVMSKANPDEFVAARSGSPLLIGVGDDESFIASDPQAIALHTDRVIYLKDGQIAHVTASTVDVYDLKLDSQSHSVEDLDTQSQEVSMEGFGSFLEKEISEQPKAIRNTTRGRIGSEDYIHLGGPEISKAQMNSLKEIVIIGCGTAYFAGHYAKSILEPMLDIKISIEHAHEFRYHHGSYSEKNTLAIFMSQSGETADTLAALKEAIRRGMMTMGIINVVGSTIARTVTHGGIYVHAGAEVSVASTKAYSCMVTALLMLGAHIHFNRGGDLATIKQLSSELQALPDEIEAVLAKKSSIKQIAKQISRHKNMFYLGRGGLYSVAAEGALKITEIAYIHAQAFPQSEMKHGPIALIDEDHLSIILMPEDEMLYKKSVSTIEEIKARGGKVLSVSTRPKPDQSDHHIEIDYPGKYTDGLIYNIVLQLLALYVTEDLGNNIDKPRNLAKSVTVE